jgi:hypothetical protein
MLRGFGCFVRVWAGSLSSAGLAPILLTGSRREASEVVVSARLATEDNVGVFAAIR